MTRALVLLLCLAALGCRKQEAQVIEAIAPQPHTTAQAPETPDDRGFDDRVLQFGMALEANDSARVVAALADDVSVTWAGDTQAVCTGPVACWDAWQGLKRGPTPGTLEPVLWLLAAPKIRIMQGVWQGKRGETPLGIGVAAVVEGDAQDKIARIRVFASKQAWRSQAAPELGLPGVPTAVANGPYEAIHGAVNFDPEPLADALSPLALAEDATAAGRLDGALAWHDAATGRTYEGADTVRLALQQARVAMPVQFVRTLNVWAVGSWLAVERLVATGPSATATHVATVLQLVRTLNGRVVEVWQYGEGTPSVPPPPQ